MSTFFCQCAQALLTILAIWLLCLDIGLSAANVYMNHFAVHIEGGLHAANRVARETGFINLGQIGSLEDHYLFEAPNRQRRSASPSHEHHAVLQGHSQVNWFEQQVARSRTKRDFHPRDVAQQMSIIDPYWKDQWYLNEGGYGGNDMNVKDAWRKGFTGKNIVVTILDDGLEHTHPDLQRNYDAYASYDVNDHDSDPMPRYDITNENRHGTRCAGEVSAEANNTYCTIGIAPDSRIGGVRMLDGDVYDAVEAASLSFNRSHIDIYSASWGPDDDGKVVDGPGALAKQAFTRGIELGRGGKGSIFVWASGNGGSSQDSCNCDGYANSIFTLSISSTSEKGVKPWYLEECSSTLATTYSSGAYNERQIASTDLHKMCTTTHTGTSASAPLAAGIVALILEANNGLTWRDVQYITLMSSRPDPIRDGQWVTNGVGRKVSLRYGYGLMDASAMVDLALVWTNVPAKRECHVKSDVRDEELEAHKVFTAQVDSDGCSSSSTEVNYLEHVQAKISLTYARRGDVVIYLTSPMGTRSKLLPRRPSDVVQGGFNDWPFLSVHFWGEKPHGTWTLEIEDGDPYSNRENGGTITAWSLILHGTKEQPVHLKNASSVSPPHTDLTVKPEVTVLSATTTHPQPVATDSCPDKCCSDSKQQECGPCKHVTIGKSSQCVFQCPAGYYTSKDTCLQCDLSCSTCSGPTVTQCLSCPAGHKLHQVQNVNFVCFEECLPGFYLSANACLPCDPSCRDCNSSPTDCTACQHDRVLHGNQCVSEPEKHFIHQPESIVLVLGLVSLAMLLLTALIFGLFYSRSHGYLCWASRSQYGKVPREDDDDVVVRLTYSDDVEDNFNA